ncbi:MAG TPA: hypothetical protein VJ487_01935 [Alphaproteobacteria bacterium]|nr:hypothetical protein [Alphaproteobacteria bacterium]
MTFMLAKAVGRRGLMVRRALFSMLVAALGILVVAGSEAAPAVSWQESVSPSYRIGIRDKFGDLGQYDASFIVSDGKHDWTKTIHVRNDDWGFVLFPDDFEDGTFANFNNVKYRWRATVNGKAVISGRFTLVRPPFD